MPCIPHFRSNASKQQSKTRLFCLFTEADREENSALLPKFHIQTVIFSRETRWTNLPALLSARAGKVQIKGAQSFLCFCGLGWLKREAFEGREGGKKTAIFQSDQDSGFLLIFSVKTRNAFGFI